MKRAQKRKICFVITNRIHYARSKYLLQFLNRNKNVELQLIVGGSALLDKYGNVLPEITSDNLPINEKLYTSVEGGDHVAMAKTTGLAILEFTTAFQKLNPDIVLLRGDRFEVLAAAITAAYLNKTIAHIEGGDVSGNIDESVRHAITKLVHIHFVTNEDSRRRVLKLGENPNYVFNVGSPDIECIKKTSDIDDFSMLNEEEGVGGKVNLKKSFVMVMQHPVTSDNNNLENVWETIRAVNELRVPALWFWPNMDAGTDEVSRGIRQFREKYNPSHIKFVKQVPSDIFINLLRRTRCMIGNSSSGIKECSYLGIPAVNIGTRQSRRFAGEHMIDVAHNKTQIKRAIKKQLAHGPYPPNLYYHKPNTSKKIAEILEKTNLYTQKAFYEGEQ